MAYLLAGWDFARFESSDQFNITVTPSAGAPQAITETSGTYAHRDLQAVTGSGYYDDFATRLKSKLDALAPSRVYTVTWAAATGYTMSVGGGATFAIAFNNTRSSQLLGFSGNLSAAASHASDRTPYYYLALARDGLSKYSRPFERAEQTKRVISSSGNAYSIGPATRERGLKGTLRFQTLATVFADEAASSVPWTYEHLVQHARCWEPLLLSLGPSSSPTEDLVVKLIRGEFDDEARNPVWNDYHGKWDLPLDLQYLGAL
jgi:hypothetical protein